MALQLIESEKDIRRGVKFLCKACPHMKAVYELTGEPPLRRNQGGFEGLCKIIVGQQLSIASADAIWSRLIGAVQPLTANVVLEKRDELLRSAGLSAAKCKTIKSLGKAINDGRLDLDDLERMRDDEVLDQLTQVQGIGPWTSDIYILFCLGRADGWASGDLALKKAVQHLMDRNDPPAMLEMEKLSSRWRPWRGVAARLLWEYYRIIRNRKTGQPI